MTEFAEHRNIETTCQEKLAPPRSLRDEGEDAQKIWNVIVKRYPKAAPLLWKMDVAIERAENLVRKFRESYTNDIGIETPSSDESNTMVTAYSSSTQLSTSEENFSVQVDLSSFSSSSDDQVAASSSKSLIVDETIKSNTSKNSMAEKTLKIGEDSSTGQKQNSTIFEQIKEVSTLEKQEKTDCIGANNSTKLGNVKDNSNYHPDRSDSLEEILKRSSTKNTVTKVHSNTKNLPVIVNETNVIPRRAVAENIRSTATKIPRTESSLRSKKRAKSASNVSPVRGTIANIVPEGGNVERNSEKKIHDEKSSEIVMETTPVTILENYAKQCNEKLEFNVIRNKPNSCEIECSFAGYSAKSMGHPKSSVEIKVATLVLRKLAEDQMDEKDMKKLIPFTTEQMRYVVDLGTDGQPENGMRKLYKLCIEKNVSKPIYLVKTGYASEGVRKIVECTAFNKVATGSEIREEKAKIAAADELYTQLLEENKQT